MICRPDLRPLLAVAGVLMLVPPAAAVPAAQPLREAAAAVARGDGLGAEVALERAVAAGVPRTELAVLAGEAALLQGNLPAAREWLGPAEFSDDQQARGFHALGRLEMLEGNADAAARAFDRALSAGGESALLWVDIGRLRYRVGQHRLALEAAVTAVEKDQGEPRALEFRGQLARDAEGMLAALPWFERALERAPDDVGLLGEYAATLGDAGRHRDMLRVARRMVALDPRHPRAYFLQAVLAARAGRDDLARRLLWRARGAYDGSPAGRLLSGILELRTGSAAVAVERFDALARSQPDNASVSLLLGRALMADGEPGEVVARLGPAADRGDAPAYLLTLVGRALEQLGRREEAASYLDRAAAAPAGRFDVLPFAAPEGFLGERTPGQPNGAEVTVPLLRKLLAERRRADAVAAARRLAARHPGSADVAKLAGDVLLLAGDPRGALARYREAAVIRRDYALVERLMAARRMLGQPDAAEALLAEHLARNPMDGEAAALLGRAFAERGEWRRAAALLRHARRLTGARDPRLLSDLAVAEFMAEDPEAAEDAAARAYRLQRANVRVAAVLCRILQARDDRQQEALALRAKVTRAPASALARR